MADRFLLADVGGTNTRVGLGTDAGVVPETVETFRNRDHQNLASVFDTYLTQHPGPITAICAGVAGPVRGGCAQLTNWGWHIDEDALQKSTGAKSVHLLNDLQAQGYALDDIAAGNVTQLVEGAPAPPGAIRLVMGLGTGSNIAVVHRMAGGLFVPPSETGHTCLPHMDGDTHALIQHLSETEFHKPVEAALSGPGLARIYRFVCGETATASDIIARHEAGDIDAGITLELFVDIFGKVAGDIALSHLPMGGVYLIGGLARAVAPHLATFGFLDRFTAKGPYSKIMRDIPVFVVDDDTAALKGCARFLR